tara:strand:+ start:10013 stop:11353 length:1341 start_codon:yes stop_codon:yes gene_type:complete
MVLAKSQIKSISYLASILLCSLALSYSIFRLHFILGSIALGFLWLLLSYKLWQNINRTNRHLSEILSLSAANDFQSKLPRQNTKSSEGQLYQLINLWLDKLAELRLGKEEELLKYKLSIENLPLGILLISEANKLVLINKLGAEFLNIRSANQTKEWSKNLPYLERFIGSEAAKEKKVNLYKNGEKQKWLLRKDQFSDAGQRYTIVSIENIQLRSENDESETLDKITHILTHEIMNSVSPISSLIDTQEQQLKAAIAGEPFLKEEEIQDLYLGVQIIKRRSVALMQFVERYAQYARLPRLKMEKIKLSSFFQEIVTLYEEGKESKKLNLKIDLEFPQQVVKADPILLSQVFLNLIKNALEAAPSDLVKINIRVRNGDGYTYMSVQDDGPLIEDSISESIFIPFFSTKQRGSGIGLSLSRKIIIAHGGRLYLKQKGETKSFEIEIPA